MNKDEAIFSEQITAKQFTSFISIERSAAHYGTRKQLFRPSKGTEERQFHLTLLPRPKFSIFKARILYQT
jgi:hypothetical protein